MTSAYFDQQEISGFAAGVEADLLDDKTSKTVSD